MLLQMAVFLRLIQAPGQNGVQAASRKALASSPHVVHATSFIEHHCRIINKPSNALIPNDVFAARHSHFIVYSQARFMGKTRDLAAGQRVDTDSFTVAIRVFAERTCMDQGHGWSCPALEDRKLGRQAALCRHRGAALPHGDGGFCHLDGIAIRLALVPRVRITIWIFVRIMGMAESTITAKGQTTVPADIRALVNAKPGTRLVWSAMPDGTIIVRAKTKSILDMAGMLRAPKGKHVSIDDMNPWR
jgi:AbrB family looped-hinge helix DNA binding protein